ncbi:MAG TPA: AAA family ATPase [Solirubrobacteraceae bacterium]|nr:AAA family ATPase [Solirubrobacteraceae bacterium]
MQAVVLCGIQGAGKTTFFWRRFGATHVRISRDLLRTPARERRFLELCLETRQPFVVDKVNATVDDRRPYVEGAREHGFELCAYWFDVRPRDAIARNHARRGRERIPLAGLLGAYKRLQVPSAEEGFAKVHRVTVDPEGGFAVVPLHGAPAPA